MKRSTLSLPFTANKIYDLYLVENKSVAQIAAIYKCSQNKINYWIEKFEIPKRTISEAVYVSKNPTGDPFKFREPSTLEEGILFGLGLGIYWGEGVKRGKGGLRITNTDPKLLKKSIDFLEKFFGIDRNRLKFSIQIFEDISSIKAINYWSEELKIDRKQFYKPRVSIAKRKEINKPKSKNGVVTLYFNNMKLKKIICNMIDKIQ